MHSVIFIEVCATDVAIEADSVLVGILWRLHHVKPVSDHVGVLLPPGEILDLLHGDKPGQIVHFCLRVGTVSLET